MPPPLFVVEVVSPGSSNTFLEFSLGGDTPIGVALCHRISDGGGDRSSAMYCGARSPFFTIIWGDRTITKIC